MHKLTVNVSLRLVPLPVLQVFVAEKRNWLGKEGEGEGGSQHRRKIANKPGLAARARP